MRYALGALAVLGMVVGLVATIFPDRVGAWQRRRYGERALAPRDLELLRWRGVVTILAALGALVILLAEAR